MQTVDVVIYTNGERRVIGSAQVEFVDGYINIGATIKPGIVTTGGPMFLSIKKEEVPNDRGQVDPRRTSPVRVSGSSQCNGPAKR